MVNVEVRKLECAREIQTEQTFSACRDRTTPKRNLSRWDGAKMRVQATQAALTSPSPRNFTSAPIRHLTVAASRTILDHQHLNYIIVFSRRPHEHLPGRSQLHCRLIKENSSDRQPRAHSYGLHQKPPTFNPHQDGERSFKP